MSFDAFIGIDWSGAAQPGYAGIAVARCDAGRGPPRLIAPPERARRWTRQAVLDWLIAELCRGQRLLVGFDFAFCLPDLAGLGHRDAFDLWAAVDAHCAADADLLGRRYVERDARFWTAGRKPANWHRHPRRAAETACANAGLGHPQSPLQLIGAKQVGKGALAGMRLLHRLHREHAERIAIWPFDVLRNDDPRSVCVEIYPRLFIRSAGLGNTKLRDGAVLDHALHALESDAASLAAVDDHEADALVSAAGLRRCVDDLSLWQAGLAQPEGWIFGVPSTGDRALRKHDGASDSGR